VTKWNVSPSFRCSADDVTHDTNQTEVSMNSRKLSMILSAIIVLLLAAGVAGAVAERETQAPTAVEVAVSSGISYQGRVTTAGGAPLNGTYPMRFIVYDQEAAGSALWDSGTINVPVADGLFNVKLGVDHADFNGRALWLSISVDGETLSPRQEILPAPYALSLRPGADIVGDSIAGADAVLAGYAPATGTAIYADANGGVGLFGDSENSYGVWGSSNDSWGGYFTSGGGYGIRVNTDGTDHYDHGAYITAQGGYGVYAQSAVNQAVRGEAGNVTGISQPLGAVGVVGIGANRGTYGASSSGNGVYGVSSSNYGLWAQSTDFRGATGRTSRADNNYGFYTPDNIFALNYTMSGAMMVVMQNNGDESLAPGDVVVFSGVNRAVDAIEGPVVQVSKADTANSTAVAGVVFSRFNIDAIDPSLESSDDAAAVAAMEVTPAGSAERGEFVLVVVQGPAEVRASTLAGGSIEPGDLLSSAASPGMAGRAATMTTSGVETALPGTVFAKALEAFDGDEEMIYIYVTLQ
jgi:hypothetical protein